MASEKGHPLRHACDVNQDINIELARSGRITSRNCERLGYQRILTGAYAQAVPPTDNADHAAVRERWLTAVHAIMALQVGRDVVLYGATALQAMGVQLPERLQDWTTVHILVPTQTKRTHRQGVIAHHQARPASVWRLVDGLPVLHPVDHWVQMTNATVSEMVEIGDGFLRRHNPLLTLAEVHSRLGELDGVHGVKLARRALPLLRPGTDSLYESRTRLVLVHAGLPTPEVNLPVWCPSVDFTYHVDMGYEKARTGVEFDGIGHSDRTQMDIDANRRRNLQDSDWLLISVTSTQLRRPESFIRSVQNALVMRTGQWD
ncbi:MAG: hypothetical protein FWD63_02340 [Propionibacteriaceae bacterium]|nr:hypothetical protein [Propionibacteriaceae bacterium]